MWFNVKGGTGFSASFPEKVSLFELGAHHFSSWSTWPQKQGIFGSHASSPNSTGVKRVSSIRAFSIVLGIRTQVLRLAKRELLSTEGIKISYQDISPIKRKLPKGMFPLKTSTV